MADINRPVARTSPRDRRRLGPSATTPVPVTAAAAAQSLVPTGSVRFWPPGYPDHAVMVPMGPRGWELNIDAGWEGRQRPFGLPLAAWKGMPAITATVDVVFERWEDQDSVQPAYELLIGLANHGPNPVGPAGTRPKPVMVTRGTTHNKVIRPNDDKGNRWLIMSIEPEDDEDSTVRDDNDRFIRVEAVVTLMWYPGDRALRDSATVIRAASRQLATAKKKPYKSEPGDTLLTIADHELHDRSRWEDLQELNPKIRDPRAKIKAGTLIQLP